MTYKNILSLYDCKIETNKNVQTKTWQKKSWSGQLFVTVNRIALIS